MPPESTLTSEPTEQEPPLQKPDWEPNYPIPRAEVLFNEVANDDDHERQRSSSLRLIVKKVKADIENKYNRKNRDVEGSDFGHEVLEYFQMFGHRPEIDVTKNPFDVDEAILELHEYIESFPKKQRAEARAKAESELIIGFAGVAGEVVTANALSYLAGHETSGEHRVNPRWHIYEPASTAGAVAGNIDTFALSQGLSDDAKELFFKQMDEDRQGVDLIIHRKHKAVFLQIKTLPLTASLPHKVIYPVFHSENIPQLVEGLINDSTVRSKQNETAESTHQRVLSLQDDATDSLTKAFDYAQLFNNVATALVLLPSTKQQKNRQAHGQETFYDPDYLIPSERLMGTVLTDLSPKK